jgi:MFS transporter, DHA2 family, multidrug resistance protein
MQLMLKIFSTGSLTMLSADTYDRRNLSKAVHQRDDELFHGARRFDFATAQHKAIVALGQTVNRQALVMAFSDTFAVIGVMLPIAAVVLVFARKGKTGAVALGAH